ncbi:MAG: adenosylcobinamide-phosphate synthase CbiB [Actinomycetia bacterium]|nr:adenosylcobinamide-phosphate synthase CbiB [Actinomycetes bacterium]
MFSVWWDSFFLNVLVFVLAVVMDRLLPEFPAKLHPVVWIGCATNAVGRAAPQRPVLAFLFGCLITVMVVASSGGLAFLMVISLVHVHPVAYVLGGAVLLRITFTVRGLLVAAGQTRQALDEGRLDVARASLSSLVSRDPTSLTAPLVAASAIESVAENTTDSYVGPWLAFGLLGLPGAVVYRAINTLDSMLGYRGDYEYLGKAAARLDDAVNLIPARVSAVLLMVSGSFSRLPARHAWQVMLRDRGLTASPNAGLTMGAMAGLLGVRLEKPGHYCLGKGLREPQAEDIGRAVRVAEGVALLASAVVPGLLIIRYSLIG